MRTLRKHLDEKEGIIDILNKSIGIDRVFWDRLLQRI